MSKIELSFQISKEAFELLKQIDQKGYAEYRDTEFINLDEFKNSDLFQNNIRT